VFGIALAYFTYGGQPEHCRVTNPVNAMKFSNLPRSLVRRSALHALVTALALVALVLFSTPARAQIKEPGAHNDYVVELEPHFLLDYYGYDYYGGFYGQGEAWGVGMRATIPFLKNGPISKINNNMGIGFGLDWAHNGNACGGFYGYYGRGNPYYGYYGDCSFDVFHFPVVVQWNFFLTPIISVFGEAGIGIRHFHGSVNTPYYCDPVLNPYCDYSYTRVEPLFWGGARFQFGKGSIVSAIVRIGYPYLSAGIGIMI
jgi:hypothetical protein